MLYTQAYIKKILPNTALLFAPPGAQVAPADPLVTPATPPDSAVPRPGSAGTAKTTPQAEHAAAIAAELNALATGAVAKLRDRGERELDLLASEFQNQPQLKILEREVQSRAVQVC